MEKRHGPKWEIDPHDQGGPFSRLHYYYLNYNNKYKTKRTFIGFNYLYIIVVMIDTEFVSAIKLLLIVVNLNDPYILFHTAIYLYYF